MLAPVFLTDDALLAAIPALVGFTPADSLVIVAATVNSDGGVRIGLVSRFDLRPNVTHRPGWIVAHLHRALADAPIQRLIGAVVHDNSGSDELPYRSQLDTFTELMHDRGFTNIELLHVPSFSPGVTWSCYTVASHTGSLADPAASPVTTAVVASGARIYRSRGEFQQQFTPVADEIRDRIEALADPIASEVEGEESVNDVAQLQERLARLDDAVTAATHGHLPADDASIADLLAALTGQVLRDIQLVQADRDRDAAARALWLHLWRHASDRYAPAVAGIAAMTAYLGGNGTAAIAIIDRHPQPTRLSQLVSTMIRSGIDPATVRSGVDDVALELRAELTAD